MVIFFRWAALEAERQRSEDEYRKRMEGVDLARARVDQDKAALARLQSEAVRAAEELSRRHREKEMALDRAREDLRKEAADFEEKVRHIVS